MVFLTNAHTQTKPRYKELVTRYVSLRGGNLEKQSDTPLIWTEINGGPPVSIHVFTLTCLTSPVMFRAHR